ncbi:MAG: hypothetical protein AAFQ68_03470 [Bacteroidota bacterium]
MRYSNPLAAFLAGEASPQQNDIVINWAEAAPENAELLKSLKRSWQDNSLQLEDLPKLSNSTEENNLRQDYFLQ